MNLFPSEIYNIEVVELLTIIYMFLVGALAFSNTNLDWN